MFLLYKSCWSKYFYIKKKLPNFGFHKRKLHNQHDITSSISTGNKANTDLRCGALALTGTGRPGTGHFTVCS